jgi:hypothetical protein
MTACKIFLHHHQINIADLQGCAAGTGRMCMMNSLRFCARLVGFFRVDGKGQTLLEQTRETRIFNLASTRLRWPLKDQTGQRRKLSIGCDSCDLASERWFRCVQSHQNRFCRMNDLETKLIISIQFGFPDLFERHTSHVFMYCSLGNGLRELPRVRDLPMPARLPTFHGLDESQ